jgi:hypothetical protein
MKAALFTFSTKGMGDHHIRFIDTETFGPFLMV